MHRLEHNFNTPITEAQNGYGQKQSLNIIQSCPPTQAGTPRGAQGHVQAASEDFQGSGLPSLPGQPFLKF